jgi:hypothetical protein
MTSAITNTLPALDSRNRLRVKVCPCGKSNADGKFVPHRGFENAGYCHGCGETFFPPKAGDEKTPAYTAPPPVPAQYIDLSIVQATRTVERLKRDRFITYLLTLVNADYFTLEEAATAVDAFYLGSTKTGHTIFPMLGIEALPMQRARTGQIIEYNPVTGKRVKTNTPPVDWLHRKLGIPNEATRKCFVGEHQLAERINNVKPVGIVESPKTAVIASIYYPGTVWLATCGKQGCRITDREVCKPLLNRAVTLYPDLKGYDEWQARADQLRINGVSSVSVSDLLQHKATEQDKSTTPDMDLADVLLRFKRSDITPADQ